MNNEPGATRATGMAEMNLKLIYNMRPLNEISLSVYFTCERSNEKLLQ